MSASLRVEDAVVGYGQLVVIDGVNVTANPGDFITVTGANGAGKSTLLKGLAGLHPMGFSTYQVGGADCPPESRLHRQITHSITDEWMWLDGLTLRDHLQLFASNSDPGAVEAAAETFGLAEFLDRLPSSLSSGQQQRASLSSTMVRPWQILFLDEPEKRLDDEYRFVLSETLEDLLSDRVIITATHSPELFADYATQSLQLGDS